MPLAIAGIKVRVIEHAGQCTTTALRQQACKFDDGVAHPKRFGGRLRCLLRNEAFRCRPYCEVEATGLPPTHDGKHEDDKHEDDKHEEDVETGFKAHRLLS